MEIQHEVAASELSEKRNKKSKETPHPGSSLEISETKAMSIKIAFEGEAARRILKCESELRERYSKPDMGKIIGNEVLTWSEKRWAEMVEENTDIEYFFAQIRKSADKSKSIKLLKALTEKLYSEGKETQAPQGASPSETHELNH